MLTSAALDSTFSALGDPTRRRMVERLAKGRLSISEVSAGIPMSQPAISKHVKILEQSGLIRRSVEGRVHHLELTPKSHGCSNVLDRDAAEVLERGSRPARCLPHRHV